MKEEFERVYDANFKYIYNYLYTQTLHRETAEDLTMDVFVRAMEHYESFDPQKASVRTWLVTIARNLFINHQKMLRFRRTENLDDVEEPGARDEYGLRQEAINVEVRRILEKLSPEERELLTMRYMLGMDNQEIGRIVGAESKTVSQRIVRLLKRCRGMTQAEGLLEEDW